jgi:predicted kinase
MNDCYKCGHYDAAKEIDPTGPYAICPACGYRHPFRRLPLLILCGASGSGKSTVAHHLPRMTQQAVVLDSDILWSAAFDQPETNYRDFYETWLRLAKNIAQAGKPALLVSAGGIPENIEPCVERRYFSTIHYLALVCDDAALAARLRQRPAWRQNSNSPFIATQIEFNRWFKNHAEEQTPPITLLDTTEVTVEQTAVRVVAWIEEITEGIHQEEPNKKENEL